MLTILYPNLLQQFTLIRPTLSLFLHKISKKPTKEKRDNPSLRRQAEIIVSTICKTQKKNKRKQKQWLTIIAFLFSFFFWWSWPRRPRFFFPVHFLSSIFLFFSYAFCFFWFLISNVYGYFHFCYRWYNRVSWTHCPFPPSGQKV